MARITGVIALDYSYHVKRRRKRIDACQMFTGYETSVVRIAKAWDSPHVGTVPLLLSSTLKLIWLVNVLQEISSYLIVKLISKTSSLKPSPA
jgi:hypothetical protein